MHAQQTQKGRGAAKRRDLPFGRENGSELVVKDQERKVEGKVTWKKKESPRPDRHSIPSATTAYTHTHT